MIENHTRWLDRLLDHVVWALTTPEHEVDHAEAAELMGLYVLASDWETTWSKLCTSNPDVYRLLSGVVATPAALQAGWRPSHIVWWVDEDDDSFPEVVDAELRNAVEYMNSADPEDSMVPVYDEDGDVHHWHLASDPGIRVVEASDAELEEVWDEL